MQLESAGADSVPFERLAPAVSVASNAGAYAQPMAEHVLALTLALAKRLPQNQAALARGEFDQSKLNREIRGSVVGILGFGGIGRASADAVHGARRPHPRDRALRGDARGGSSGAARSRISTSCSPSPTCS